MPVISEYRTRQPEPAVRELVASVSGTLGLVVLLVSIAGAIAAPLLVLAFAPGFLDQPEKFSLASEMLRITFPYLFFVSLTALAGGVLNTYDRFGVPAVTPAFLNLSMIAAALWLAPRMDEPVVALAWGVFAGGLAQLLFQLPFLWRRGFLVRPRLGFRHEGVRRVMRLMLPAIFGVSVAQVSLLLDTLLASFLETGSVSWLYYSDRLLEFPLGIFGIALGTVILPSLSRRFSEGAHESFSATVDWALRTVLLLGLPATIGLGLLAGPLLTTLFQHGEFRSADVYMAQLSLVAFSVGLVGFMAVKVLAPAFYARQDTRTPVRVAVKALAANMVMNLMLIFPLAHAGLALSTSLAGFVNAGLLYRLLRAQGVYQPAAGWPAFILRVLVANAALATLLFFGPAETGVWTHLPARSRLLDLGLWVLAGVAAYLAALALLGFRKRDLLPSARV